MKKQVFLGAEWRSFHPCLTTAIRSFKAWRDGAMTVLQPRISKNCSKLFGGDAEELKRVNAATANWKNVLSDQGFFEMTMNCSWVKYYFSNNLYVTELERSFPIAFSFVGHKSTTGCATF